MTFKVTITETLQKTFDIEATCEKEALQIADNNYRKEESDYILYSENLVNVDMTADKVVEK